MMASLSIGAVQADALFVSRLQRCDEPNAGQVRQAVAEAIRAFGYSGCAGRVAQEFGDHPETAVIRMRWARAWLARHSRTARNRAWVRMLPGCWSRVPGRPLSRAHQAPGRMGGQGRGGRRRLMEEGMIQAQVMAARIACARMTVRQLAELHDSVERACGLAAGSEWDRKAAAHAEIFGLLADVVDDPVLAPVLTGGAGYVRELMLAVGQAADGMVISSRRRLLVHLRAGDGEGAALEMARHLRVLHYMWRLALPSEGDRTGRGDE